MVQTSAGSAWPAGKLYSSHVSSPSLDKLAPVDWLSDLAKAVTPSSGLTNVWAVAMSNRH